MRHSLRRFAAFAIIVAAGVAACNDDAAPPAAGDAAAAGVADAADATATAPDAAPSCTEREPQPSESVWMLEVGGRERRARVRVPASYDPRVPTAVVLNFHGLTMDGAAEEDLSLMTPVAEARNFVVMYPDGTGMPRSWNAGACCSPANGSGVDDVAFVAALLDEAGRRLCLDERRIFATGMSNGGFLSHRLGCELADRIAAIAPVAGVNGLDRCTPPRAVPVLHFHGTSDLLVAYNGGGLSGFRSVAASTSGWVERNGCDATPQVTFDREDTQCETWSGCRDGAEVTLCTVDGGGHTWPGGAQLPAGGHTTTAISASDAMWDFFSRHPLR